jgi:hypothetical protein
MPPPPRVARQQRSFVTIARMHTPNNRNLGEPWHQPANLLPTPMINIPYRPYGQDPIDRISGNSTSSESTGMRPVPHHPWDLDRNGAGPITVAYWPSALTVPKPGKVLGASPIPEPDIPLSGQPHPPARHTVIGPAPYRPWWVRPANFPTGSAPAGLDSGGWPPTSTQARNPFCKSRFPSARNTATLFEPKRGTQRCPLEPVGNLGGSRVFTRLLPRPGVVADSCTSPISLSLGSQLSIYAVPVWTMDRYVGWMAYGLPHTLASRNSNEYPERFYSMPSQAAIQELHCYNGLI